MNPSIWGPHAWIFLHSITLAYPDCPSNEDKKNIKDFFSALQNILPCPKCKLNYKHHITKYPLTNQILCSKKKLILWLIDVHNAVNKATDKKMLSHEMALKSMYDIYDQPSANYKVLCVSIIITIMCFFILLCMFVFCRKRLYGIKRNVM